MAQAEHPIHKFQIQILAPMQKSGIITRAAASVAGRDGAETEESQLAGLQSCSSFSNRPCHKDRSKSDRTGHLSSLSGFYSPKSGHQHAPNARMHAHTHMLEQIRNNANKSQIFFLGYEIDTKNDLDGVMTASNSLRFQARVRINIKSIYIYTKSTHNIFVSVYLASWSNYKFSIPNCKPRWQTKAELNFLHGTTLEKGFFSSLIV